MQHLPILPVLLPLVVAIVLLRKREGVDPVRRTISITATSVLVIVSALLVGQVAGGDTLVYRLGNWQAPYGIVLVADRLSAMMVLLTALLALGSVIHASGGEDNQGSNFHGLFNLQLMGINGAFLTGDLFNLFVFFEVLLLASYALLMHGGGKARVQSGLHYVVLNLAGSSLFLIALGVLYGSIGTLNMADMAERVSQLPADRQGLVRAGALLLLVVFGLKSAILPLYFWLPRAYSSAPAPIAALFAIMTKVGIYAIFRVFTLIFGEQAAGLSLLAQPWLWWGGLATLALAMVAILAARDLRMQISYFMLISIGTLLCGLGMEGTASRGAMLFYMLHTTLINGGLFLLADLIADQRGKVGTRIVRSRKFKYATLLSALYMLGAMASAGLPPLSGAVAKAWLMSTATLSEGLWLWPLLLLSGLAGVVAASRAGSTIFWRHSNGERVGEHLSRAKLIGTVVLLSAAPLLVVLAGPVGNYTQATAEQIANTVEYRSAVLGEVTSVTPGASTHAD
ncbi:multisubunit potassium/proton antiporter, PhaD subunit [Kushneria avicenniae]|uniref:Multisubunit potassium/proton antiporter, PhaD subunit n=2 Tax=Kushneria avicenniae TaxID=402385 RepID=A0A1I1KGX3_9GAMM|nr:multisubunit potassium/proton antiporter, PhaD subunit [Kushneria avicenniae]